MKSYGVILSFLFHACLCALVAIWPATPPKPIEEVHQISLIMGTMGGLNLPSPVLGMMPPDAKEPNIVHELSDIATQNQQKPAEQMASLNGKPEADPDPVPIPTPTLPEPVALPAPPKEAELDLKPEEVPEEIPIPKPEEKTKPKEKLEEKPIPKPEEKPKPKEKPAEKPIPKPEEKPAPKIETPPASNETPTKAKPPVSAASALLAELESQSNSQNIGGGGGSGSGQGGGGIYDVYAGLVILAVKPNWSMPTYSRTNLVVKIRISLDATGKILDAEIAESSGRADFDASAINAVLRTHTLPKPPSQNQQELIISFNSQELAGR